MTNLCRSLEAEHRVIEMVLDAIERETDAIDGGKAVDRAFFERVLAFIREFADGLHHRKEEQALFPRMVAAGVPNEGGPVGVMLYEHEQGRACVRAMAEALEQAEAGDAAARAGLVAAARQYVELLRAHIVKEDCVLFPMAEDLFSPKQRTEIEAHFAAAEQVDPHKDEQYRKWAMDAGER
jgi:hemerythrin-like domain-containing protein